jgi:hypothetical protein
MEAKYKQFLEFNWRDSAEWQNYYRDIYPTPPGNRIEHYKKKFYKLKVDPDFDIKWTPSDNTQNTQNTTPNTSYSSTPGNNTYRAPGASSMNTGISKIASHFEAFFWLCFIVTIFVQYHTLKLGTIALLIRIFRRIGRPRLTIEYAQELFLDEHFQTMLYLLLLMIDRITFFSLLPIAITAVLNLSLYVRQNQNIFRPLVPYCDKVISKRVEIARSRANVELGVGILFIFGIFLGLNSFVLPIFYWQYLRFKYIVNEDIKAAFGRLNVYVNSLKNKPWLPGGAKYVINKIQEFFDYLGRTEATANQRAGGQNCTIF